MGMAAKGPSKRKRRTRAHIIAEMSVNYLERKVLQCGYQLSRSNRVEYGTDAVMYHFGEDGSIENGQVQFQLKATDHVAFTQDRKFLCIVVDEGNLDHSSKDLYPFILVVYDAQKEQAFWLHVQEYVQTNKIYPDRDTVTLRIPAKNKLTIHAVERFANFSRRIALSQRNLNEE
jgi:hypothetical protein